MTTIMLADFIDTVRAELAVAAERRQEQKRLADSLGARDPVGDLAITDVVIEANVVVQAETSAEGGIKVWVLGAGGKRQTSHGTTHKVTIRLSAPSGVVLGPAGPRDGSVTPHPVPKRGRRRP